jgi:hypothetical protein
MWSANEIFGPPSLPNTFTFWFYVLHSAQPLHGKATNVIGVLKNLPKTDIKLKRKIISMQTTFPTSRCKVHRNLGGLDGLDFVPNFQIYFLMSFTTSVNLIIYTCFLSYFSYLFGKYSLQIGEPDVSCVM